MNEKISVVMATYNASEFLRDSIDSIQNQTFKDFEFVIIDDGSTDDTQDILTELAQQDSRLKVIRNRTNVGLTICLNQGINSAVGEFIARMDADDLAIPQRFEKQIERFLVDPDLVIVGCNVLHTNSNLCPIYQSNFPLDDWDIRSYCLINNPFPHSGVMMRAKLFLEDGLSYDENYYVGQDYELWTRLLFFGKAENIPDPLMLLRNHSRSVTAKYQTEQEKVRRYSARQYQNHFLGELLTESMSGSSATGSDATPTGSHDKNDLDLLESCYRSLGVFKAFQSAYADLPSNYLVNRIAINCLKTIIQTLFKSGWFRLVSTVFRQYPLFVPLAVLYLVKHFIFTLRTSSIRGFYKQIFKGDRFFE